MNVIKHMVRAVSSWSFTPLVVRGVALVGVTTILAHIGEGALPRLDTPMVQPAYAASIRAPIASAPLDSLASLVDDSSRAELAATGKAGAPVSHCHPDALGCGGKRPPGVTADGRIILNTANAQELVKLPGIGKSRAAAILALRKKLGRFRRVRDLLRVRGIGFRSLRKIQPLVVVDPPKQAKGREGSNHAEPS